ncbi:KH domain protein, partial [Opisthorchis viverrini]
DVHLKLLIPCVAAGAIIGKGGEAVESIKRQTGARLKMSKANDFYPGTTERVCLIVGTMKACMQLSDYIMKKISERTDPPSPVSHPVSTSTTCLPVHMERHNQVKILVPNSTAGVIIGKSGSFIKKIKEMSGAFVQISQRPKGLKLMERCIIITGDMDERRLALSMVLSKIAEDPDSASCPNCSYVQIHEPVASAYPTGSPYAVNTNESQPSVPYATTNLPYVDADQSCVKMDLAPTAPVYSPLLFGPPIQNSGRLFHALFHGFQNGNTRMVLKSCGMMFQRNGAPFANPAIAIALRIQRDNCMDTMCLCEARLLDSGSKRDFCSTTPGYQEIPTFIPVDDTLLPNPSYLTAIANAMGTFTVTPPQHLSGSKLVALPSPYSPPVAWLTTNTFPFGQYQGPSSLVPSEFLTPPTTQCGSLLPSLLGFQSADSLATTARTPVLPTVISPCYSDSCFSQRSPVQSTPIYGNATQLCHGVLNPGPVCSVNTIGLAASAEGPVYCVPPAFSSGHAPNSLQFFCFHPPSVSSSVSNCLTTSGVPLSPFPSSIVPNGTQPSYNNTTQTSSGGLLIVGTTQQVKNALSAMHLNPRLPSDISSASSNQTLSGRASINTFANHFATSFPPDAPLRLDLIQPHHPPETAPPQASLDQTTTR